MILGVFENRSWIEFFFEGDLVHTQDRQSSRRFGLRYLC
jgi:hypothetical protein